MSVEWPSGRDEGGAVWLFTAMMGIVVLIAFVLWPIMAVTDPHSLRKGRGSQFFG